MKKSKKMFMDVSEAVVEEEKEKFPEEGFNECAHVNL